MLSELSIENLALFERETLAFGRGLNVISGETGAGKSLLLGALELLFGDRSRASSVRKGAAEARVEGRFVFARGEPALLDVWLVEHVPAVADEWAALASDDERELILARALSSEGKTRAWVNHRPVTQKLLRELASLLVEVHGQGEHQRLLDPKEQRRLLDAFGGLEGALADYRDLRSRWLATRTLLEQARNRTRESRERLDFLRFQLNELRAANLSAGEHAELVREREMLRHAAELWTDLGAVANDLTEADPSLLDGLRRALRALERWEVRIAGVSDAAEDLREALLRAEAGAAAIATFLRGVEVSPARLEAVEARLFQLEELERKYGTDFPGLLARAREIEAELERLDVPADRLNELTQQAASELARASTAARALSKSRRTLATKLRRAVESSLADLGLSRARFDVHLTPISSDADGAELGPDGMDDVEFALAANPGEDMRALRHVASGGEAARILLALRTALAVRQATPILVFDEIDAGVGGRLGPKIGEHLRNLTARHQVLCVTHLPGVAALAHHHFKVAKHVVGGRTRTAVQALAGDARIDEIADMIAGGGGEATARAEAKRLLDAARA